MGPSGYLLSMTPPAGPSPSSSSPSPSGRRIVDPTGAGNAFLGAFAVSLRGDGESEGGGCVWIGGVELRAGASLVYRSCL